MESMRQEKWLKAIKEDSLLLGSIFLNEKGSWGDVATNIIIC